MLRTTLANLRTHKARLALSSLAIVLGVAFVAGTFVLTDAIRNAFLTGFAEDVGQADVVVTQESGEAAGAPSQERGSALSPDVVTAVRGVEGVAHASGRISTRVTRELRDGNGAPVPGSTGTFLTSIPKSAELQWYDVTRGRLPRERGEALLDLDTAEHTSLGLGERVQVPLAPAPGERASPGNGGGASGSGEDAAGPRTRVSPGSGATETRSLRVVGLVDRGDSPQYAGAPFVATTIPQAAAIAGDRNFGMVLAGGVGGVAPSELAERVRDTMGPAVTVRTGEAQAAHEAEEELGGAMTSVTLALLAFAGVAMFVAAIVIANTFAILLAQRTRELALLRCAGATRAQVFRSVLLEAAALGLAGSLAGVAAGYGLATGVGTVLHAATDNFPFRAQPPGLLAVILPAAVGVAVTLAAAYAPARNATRVAPVAALRERIESPARRTGRVRTILAVLGVCGGTAALAAGVFAPLEVSIGFVIAFGGGVAAFGGILLAGPLLIPPAIRLVGALAGRILGTPGRLAVANTLRNPRRASATTSALLVGATLIGLMTVGAASTRASMTAELDDQFPVDYLISASSGKVPDSVVDEIRAIPGLSDVAVTHGATTRMEGRRASVGGVNPQALRAVTTALPELSQLESGEVVLSETLSRRLRLGAGDTLSLDGDSGSAATLTVSSVTGQGAAAAFTTQRDFAPIFPDAPVRGVYARAAPEADLAEVSAAVDEAAAAPQLSVSGTAETKASFSRVLDTMLLVTVALLGVAVLIALVGIANTLSLSVIERTRETGLLRALGLTRRQLRGMLAGEAALLGLVGGLLGTGLGIAFGWAGTAALLPGATTLHLAVPGGRIAALLAVAVMAALLASVLPGRRAARASIVSALADE